MKIAAPVTAPNIAAFLPGEIDEELVVAVRAAAVTQKVSPTFEKVRP